MRRPWLVCSFFLMLSMMMLLGWNLWSTVARDQEGRDLWSTVALGWWLWWEEEGRTSVAFPEARVWSRMGHGIKTMLGLRAGPSRRWRRSGPLPTPMAPGRVTSPGWLVTSRRSTMVISVTTLIIVWMVAIWSPSHRRVVGPWGSIYHRHTGWDSFTGLLIMGSVRPVIRSLRRLGWDGWLVFLCRVLLLPGRPVISLFDGWGLQSVLWSMQVNGIIHRVVRSFRGCCRLPLLLQSFVQRSPRLR